MSDDKIDMYTAIANIVNDMENHLRLVFIRAKLCRAYYLGLEKEGFSESQALELCKEFKMG